jgi:hypothetical protein
MCTVHTANEYYWHITLFCRFISYNSFAISVEWEVSFTLKVSQNLHMACQ